MTTYIRDIVSPVLVYSNLQEGRLREQSHPDNPDLRVIGYTEVVQYSGEWDDSTLEMRGLVYNSRTDEVLARPFGKFFTMGQKEAVEPALDAEIVAYDKADGSLISFGSYGCSTRGSFASEQAVAATRWLQDKVRIKDWANNWSSKGITLMFEWVGPDNRVVLSYEESELIFLGARRIENGAYILPEHLSAPTDLRIVDRVFTGTWGDFLADSSLMERGLEGVVIWSGLEGPLLKVKEERYVELHRLVTGLNEKAVWAVGPDGLDELLERLPDEFHEWTREVHWKLLTRAKDKVRSAVHAHALVAAYPRKEWMSRLKSSGLNEQSRYVFAYEDGRDVLSIAWEAVKPVASISPE